ncbi:CheR family methyltransferase [Sphingomicrobium nitratireducens]|uniref:CheR family methyltransferase n=1 Tax=Sphingomicrobium nitratireducens TaxID=2964666 RepID=UPI00223FD7EC|nr:protein-glutamate O-methyltransferase CheR [Sphingomicrobium nitratireducens]
MEVSDSSSRILAGLLEARTGQQLTMSRRWRIETALSALLRERSIATLDELITILVMNKDPKLADAVVEALLNNETYFFRDRAPFDMIGQRFLPEIAQRRPDKRLRIWSAGCSSGQEAYSIAMMLSADPLRWQGWTFDIIGTDVSDAVISKARRAHYTQFEVQRGLGIQETIRWFEEDEDGWQANEKLRKMVKFEVRNILDAPPMGGPFDLVLCRNVLLYLNNERRRAAFERISTVIAPDGGLLLGAGETVIGQTERFAADRGHRGLYRPVDLTSPEAKLLGT